MNDKIEKAIYDPSRWKSEEHVSLIDFTNSIDEECLELRPIENPDLHVLCVVFSTILTDEELKAFENYEFHIESCSDMFDALFERLFSNGIYVTTETSIHVESENRPQLTGGCYNRYMVCTEVYDPEKITPYDTIEFAVCVSLCYCPAKDVD